MHQHLDLSRREHDHIQVSYVVLGRTCKMDPAVLDDKEAVLVAVTQHRQALQYATEGLQRDTELTR